MIRCVVVAYEVRPRRTSRRAGHLGRPFEDTRAGLLKGARPLRFTWEARGGEREAACRHLGAADAVFEELDVPRYRARVAALAAEWGVGPTDNR